jgi:hypothetical protein
VEGGRKHIGFELFDEINDERSYEKDFGGIKDERSDNKCFEDCSLHPNNNTILRFFKIKEREREREREENNLVMSTPKIC